MNKTNKLLLILLISFTNFLFAKEKDYTKDLEVNKFINKLVKEDNFSKDDLNKLFKKVVIQKSALNYYLKPKKSDFEIKNDDPGTWDRYEKKLLNKRRIELGVDFMKKNEKTLKEAYEKFGVQAEYITAIIGVESFYGRYKGNYLVFEALTTLAFEKNRRNKFFQKELREFLNLAKRNNQDPKDIYGSFAGAIGLAQFMPSNFKTLAVDFNNDKKVDLNDEADAIGSIANYFKKSGWNKKIPIATRVSYEGNRFEEFKTGINHKYDRSDLKGIKPKDKNFFYNNHVHLVKLDRRWFDELWYGTKNFYVITRYNKSSYYAMAVHKLAQEIKKKYKKRV